MSLVFLSRLFEWQPALTIVKPETLIVWHRESLRLFGDGSPASRLGQAGININYGYCGAWSDANATFLIFGVAEAGKAAKVLDQAAAAGTTN